MKKSLKVVVLILTLMSFSDLALAQSASTLADIANNLIPQLGSVQPLLGALSYIFGIVFGIRGALKLKEYNETKGQQVKLTVPIVYIIAASMFLSLPKLIDIGITTFGFDQGGQQTFKY